VATDGRDFTSRTSEGKLPDIVTFLKALRNKRGVGDTIEQKLGFLSLWTSIETTMSIGPWKFGAADATANADAGKNWSRCDLFG
jgi:hypothetical protein